MKTKYQHPKNQQLNNPTKREYEVCEVQSANCITKFGMYVSQPWKYAGTHILLHCGMALHYFATFGYLHPALAIINILLHILNTVVLIIIGFTDPGMIPKILPGYEKLYYRKIPTNYHHYSTLLKYYKKNYRAIVKGHNLQLKFCNTCYIYRPPRAVHCEDCGICVEKFDHHCPWIGTCVAKRNYKYFLTFLTFLSVLTTKLLIQTIVVTSQIAKWEGAQIIAKSVINIFLCIYIFPAMAFAVFMLILHIKLAGGNVTTNQFCKQKWENLEGNPFKKRSGIKNLIKILSLHYQGKVKFEEPVFDRHDRFMLQNDSMSSLNESKDADKILQNLNNVNQTNYKSHQNYSTKEGPDKQDGGKINQSQLDHQENQLSNECSKVQNLQRENFKKTELFQDAKPTALDTVSVCDISLRVQGQYKQQRPQLKKEANKIKGNQSAIKSNSWSVQTQNDRSQNQKQEVQREDQRKLKVIIQENQSQLDHNIDANFDYSIRLSIQKNQKQKNQQISVIKMDQTFDDSVLRQKNQQQNRGNQKQIKSHGTIAIGNFRKRKKSVSSNKPRLI